MTDAQLKARCEQISDDVWYKFREFRKQCVTQGIVEFVREEGHFYYEMKYRGVYVCTIFRNNNSEELKLRAVWNTIRIAETIKKD